MKIKTQYVCQGCGHASAKWLGRCGACGEWNTLVEESIAPPASTSSASARASRDAYLDMGTSGGGGYVDLDASGEEGELGGRHLTRNSTGITELDRVLGGGLVPDSFVLLGGDPGIGKSTLLLQMAKGLREKNENLKILYVSGEESTDQIRSRAHRLGVFGEGRIFLAAETQLERALATVKELRPDVLIMDSLQTFVSSYLESAPGSVSQVREISSRLMNLAKSARIAVWLVGHVTKEGSIAGPKTIEHMVDTVLYFESEGGQSYRLLRTVKNRFGSSRELGVFEMDGEGLREVLNPSSLFLSERKEAVSGTAVTASLEGTRPILAEVQALVARSTLAVPRRTSVGIDTARVSLIAAILEKHAKLPLHEADLFFNVAGGLKLAEPACDLAAAAAIWSSIEDRPLPVDAVFIGEVALTGEIRRVSFPEVRVEEARKLGFATVFLPASSMDRVKKITGIRLLPIARIDEIKQLVSGGSRGPTRQ